MTREYYHVVLPDLLYFGHCLKSRHPHFIAQQHDDTFTAASGGRQQAGFTDPVT